MNLFNWIVVFQNWLLPLMGTFSLLWLGLLIFYSVTERPAWFGHFVYRPRPRYCNVCGRQLDLVRVMQDGDRFCRFTGRPQETRIKGEVWACPESHVVVNHFFTPRPTTEWIDDARNALG